MTAFNRQLQLGTAGFQHVGQGALFQHASLIDNNHTIRNGLDLFHVVRGVNYCAAALRELLYCLQQKSARLRIDADGVWTSAVNSTGKIF